jgi:hypothetical protein
MNNEYLNKIVFPEFWEDSWKRHFMSQLLLIELRDNNIKVLYDGGGWNDRHKILLSVLNVAAENCKSSSCKRFFIFTGDDLPLNVYTPWRLLSITGRREDKEIVLPDPNSFAWNEIGIHDFESYRKEMIEFSNSCMINNKVINKTYWRGAIDQHDSRRLFHNLVKNHDLFDVQEASSTENFRQMKHVGEYSVLVDFPGRGYSGRLKHLIFSGRPVVVYPRVAWDWVTLNLEPNVHFYLSQMSHVDIANACINMLNNPEMRNFFVANSAERMKLIEKRNMIIATSKIIEACD